MKKLFYGSITVLLIALTILSCNKESEPTEYESTISKLSGTWQMIEGNYYDLNYCDTITSFSTYFEECDQTLTHYLITSYHVDYEFELDGDFEIHMYHKHKKIDFKATIENCEVIYKEEYEIYDVDLCVYSYNEETNQIDITQTYGHYSYNPLEMTFEILSLSDTELIMEVWDDREDEMVTCRFKKITE
jgi:hypothetical protein